MGCHSNQSLLYIEYAVNVVSAYTDYVINMSSNTKFIYKVVIASVYVVDVLMAALYYIQPLTLVQWL